MGNYGTFLQDLAMVLCVAAVITVIFRRLKQPVILGYLLAGLILGPHVPFPLFAHEETVKTLAELGVILVMFSIGLAFSFERFARAIPTAGLTSLIAISVMIWLGYMAGQVMGWTPLESLFTGAIVAISSTMIAVKAVAEQSPSEVLSRRVIGVLLAPASVVPISEQKTLLQRQKAFGYTYEELRLVLTPMAHGAHLSLAALVTTSGGLLGFLGLLCVAGYLIVPRLIRLVVGLRSPETLLVTTVGICFAMALLAQKGGYSTALGAFLAGMLVAESGATATIERLIHPLRDMFSAVFFVAVGMLVDPGVLLKHWGAVLLLTTVVIAGQTLGISAGAFLSGRPLKDAIQMGMSLAQIGEFSFIIARIGVDQGAIGGFLYDTTVAVSVITAFATPWLIRASGPLSHFVDSRLPRPLQTFTALYGSWLEELRSEKQAQSLFVRFRRLTGLLALDTFCLAAVIIATSTTVRRWFPQLQPYLVGIPHAWGRGFFICAGLLLTVPFLNGIFQHAKVLGGLLAAAAIPISAPDKVDFGLAPRKVLTVTLQLGVIFAVGLPLLTLTQPFLPMGYSPLVLVLALILLGIVFWKSAVNLQEHVHAGAQMVVEALAHHASKDPGVLLEEVNAMVPGIGAPTTTCINGGNPAIGKSLGKLNLRGLTGASVIAILRGQERILMPSGGEVLKENDQIVLVGTHEAIRKAEELLQQTKASIQPGHSLLG